MKNASIFFFEQIDESIFWRERFSLNIFRFHASVYVSVCVRVCVCVRQQRVETPREMGHVKATSKSSSG